MYLKVLVFLVRSELIRPVGKLIMTIARKSLCFLFPSCLVMSVENNLTLQILENAEREGYGILAQCWHVAKL